MERWQNRVAVVTEASSGIGAAIAADLVKAGLVVVALARRETRLQEIKKALQADQQQRYHPIKCDVTNEEDIKKAFAWVEKDLGGTDILVNNAGAFHYGVNLVDSDNSGVIHKIVDTNVKAVAFCVREAFNSMKKRDFAGHVIIINSVAGHTSERFPGANMYIPSKHAVTAMAQTYRHEFAHAGTKVKSRVLALELL
ncbi:farnesol dehydrogenase-like [Hermetia illucens]|uniref:farnesol dehydrogenase-like n=1 Tax=Hermetia illucens TaxID=343691 RepID=UPI0018CC59AB|nr:farnesol dehydrogenase-like [Hermetia illucens]